MVIGAVALIVIGPKDLPRALRTVGQVTGKLRRMAAEFQGQFQEAMREAELDEVKQQLQGMNNSVSGFNPIQTIRDELKTTIETPVTPTSPVLETSAAPAHDTVVPDDVAIPDRDDAAAAAHAEPAALAEAGAPVEPAAPVEPVVDLPLPPIQPVDDPAEAIAESLRREAEIETQKAAAARAVLEKTDTKAG
jgi:sec-independent protein translocase protein TatB